MFQRYSLLPFATLTPELRKKHSELEMGLLSSLRESESEDNRQQAIKVGDAAFQPWLNWVTKQPKVLLWLQQWMPLINPQEWWLLLWNLIVMITILYNFLQIPIKIFIINFVFKNPFEEHDTFDIDIAILVVYTVDIVLIRWRVAQFQRGKIKWDYKATYKHYLFSVFPFDVIAWISYAVFLGVRTNIYIKLLFIFKLASFFVIDGQVQKRISIYPLTCSIYKFIRLIIFILIVTNFAGCVFFNIDYALYIKKGFEYQYGFLWLTNSDVTQGMNILQMGPWYVWYTYSLYFAVMSTVSCGYGNLTARNPPEILFVLIIILVNIGVFSYFTGSLIGIIDDYNWKVHHRRQYMSKLTKAIFTLRIKNPVRRKIRYYMEKKVEKPLEQKEGQIYELLSFNLQQQFRLNFNREFSDHLPVMRSLFEGSQNAPWSEFAKEVIIHLQSKYLSFDDPINDGKEPILAMISRGIVSVRSQINFCQKNYRQWQYLGQREFFLGGFDLNSSIARTFTRLYFYRQKTFFSILKKYPQQRQIYCYYFDSVRINNQLTSSLSLSCSMCEERHLEQFCPINNFWKENMPWRDIEEKHNREHKRMKYVRPRVKSKKLDNGLSWRGARIDKIRNFKFYYPFINLIQLSF